MFFHLISLVALVLIFIVWGKFNEEHSFMRGCIFMTLLAIILVVFSLTVAAGISFNSGNYGEEFLVETRYLTAMPGMETNDRENTSFYLLITSTEKYYYYYDKVEKEDNINSQNMLIAYEAPMDDTIQKDNYHEVKLMHGDEEELYLKIYKSENRTSLWGYSRKSYDKWRYEFVVPSGTVIGNQETKQKEEENEGT